MLIDGGPQKYGERIMSYIKDHNVQKLDVVVITHCHPDHIGGIPKVLESIKVDKVWVNQDISVNTRYSTVYSLIQHKKIPWRIIRREDYWRNFKGVKVECLHPANITSDPNDNSIVLKIGYKKVSFLFPGDITPQAEEELLSIYKGHLKCEVLKIPHHGHRSMHPFIEATRPRIAVLTIGPNPYGAPDPETLKAYKENGCRTLRTDKVGTIVIKTNGQKIWWRTNEK